MLLALSPMYLCLSLAYLQKSLSWCPSPYIQRWLYYKVCYLVLPCIRCLKIISIFTIGKLMRKSSWKSSLKAYERACWWLWASPFISYSNPILSWSQWLTPFLFWKELVSCSSQPHPISEKWAFLLFSRANPGFGILIQCHSALLRTLN